MSAGLSYLWRAPTTDQWLLKFQPGSEAFDIFLSQCCVQCWTSALSVLDSHKTSALLCLPDGKLAWGAVAAVAAFSDTVFHLIWQFFSHKPSSLISGTLNTSVTDTQTGHYRCVCMEMEHWSVFPVGLSKWTAIEELYWLCLLFLTPHSQVVTAQC